MNDERSAQDEKKGQGGDDQVFGCARLVGRKKNGACACQEGGKWGDKAGQPITTNIWTVDGGGIGS